MPSTREQHAVKAARIGDFEPLAQLVQEGHKIETEDARKIIAERIREAAEDIDSTIDIIDGLEPMASYCEKRPAAREVEGVPIDPEKITEDELNDLIILLETAREEMINLRGKIKRLERMER